ncbi:MAG: hypothetical protein IT168_04335 [Bryobacterales bacterium]|nr:hypothetical protein [Bryobacterales bacterium]
MARPLTTIIPALVVLLTPAFGQLTEPWQTNWETFGREAAPLLRDVAIPAAGSSRFTTLTTYAGKPFEWQGEFFDYLDDTTGLMMMKPVAIPLSTGGVGLMIGVIAEFKSAAAARGLRQGQTIRFRGRLDTSANIAIIRLDDGTVTFTAWTIEVEIATDQPPTATIQLSAQGRTAGNGQTLALTAQAGQTVPVTFSAVSSTAGTGTITAYEWRNNNVVLDTKATFTANLSAATNDIQLKVTNSVGASATATARVNITLEQPAGPRLLTQAPVVHGASLEAVITSGAWVAIRGAEFTTVTRIWEGSDFLGTKLPTALNGISVRLNGKSAYVYFISPTQINVLAPDGLETGTVNVEVTTPSGVAAGTATVRERAPGFFPFDPGGRIYPAAVHLDGTFAGPTGLFGSAVVTRPPKPGDSIVLFGTGFGSTNPARSAAEVVSAPADLATKPAIRIGGVGAEAPYAGLVGSGLNQFNVVVPQVAAGDHLLEADSGGVGAQPNLFLCVGGGSGALAVNQSTLTFTATAAAPAPSAQTVEVTSTGDPLAFRATVQTDSGSWLAVDSGGQTPRALSVRVNTTGLAPGTYRGTITIDSCANTAGAKTVSVTLTIPQTGPAITSITPSAVKRGDTVTLRIAGTNMANAIAVSFDPASGITSTATRPAATEVQVDIRVATDAALGNRAVTVVTPTSRSNALNLRVDAAATQ